MRGSDWDAALALAVGCCHSSFDYAQLSKLPILADGVHWDRFLAAVRRHRVQGLAAHALRAAGVQIPHAHSRALGMDAAAIIEENLRATHASVQLNHAFRNAGVPLLFVKGLTLATLIYPYPHLKMSADVDVLIHQKHVSAAAKLLAELGYELTLPRATPLENWHFINKESVWRAPQGIHVELHTRLADNQNLIPNIGMDSQPQSVRLSGYELPTLQLDELFAYLCVHGASSLWFRLKWITDLAALLHRNRDVPLESLYATSQRLGAGRSAAQALLVADRLFNVLKEHATLRRLVKRDSSNVMLATAAWFQLRQEREPTGYPLGTLFIHLTQLLLLPKTSFKLAELRRQVKSMRINERV